MDTITFNVVRDRHGWTVCRGEQMRTPFRSRECAIREANCLADAIRSHGLIAEVVVEGAEPCEAAEGLRGLSAARLNALVERSLARSK
ncbi:MAG TPA: hypothetical protein VG939_01130 [Caulobacteraceae bacterium]|nr:hypothetical protein [Caulobacteraceae bacterium]